MAGYANLDYELSIPAGGIVRELGGEIQLEYERMSPSRADLVCTESPDLTPLTQLTVYHTRPTGRTPIWRGWLATIRKSRQWTILTFLGARWILSLAPIQAIFFRPIQVGEAFRQIVESAITVLQSNGSYGLDLQDWRVASDCGIPIQNVDLRDISDAASAIERLESLAPGWRSTFAFDSDGYFWARMVNRPRTGEFLCQGDVVEYEEDFRTTSNRLRVLMTNYIPNNLVPNGDFSQLMVLSTSETSLVPNHSFETEHANWDTPDPPFHYEWDRDYGFRGDHSFKFHDCAEYNTTAWLVSGRFPVQAGRTYKGGFAYGCDPYLAQECIGGAGSVKLKVEVRGYDNLGNYTETPLQHEITNDFHNALHWHWLSFTPFEFSNSSTTQAEIRFLTYHGKRLYLDEVIISEPTPVIQEGWQTTTTGDASVSVDWFKPEGIAEFHYVTLFINAGAGKYARLEQIPNSLTSFEPGRALYFQIWYANLPPQLSVEWINRDGGIISTQSIFMTHGFYETALGLSWYCAKGSATPPSDAVAARLILQWTNTTGSSAIRTVCAGYSERAHPPAYGYTPSPLYGSDTISYPAEADTDFVADAQDSPLQLGYLPALLIRNDIPTEQVAEEFARWYFLRRAVPARTIRIEGESIDDVRILQPHLYRWRIPLGTFSRPYVVEKLIIRHDGSWQAECGEYLPDASALMKAIFDQATKRNH